MRPEWLISIRICDFGGLVLILGASAVVSRHKHANCVDGVLKLIAICLAETLPDSILDKGWLGDNIRRVTMFWSEKTSFELKVT